MMVRIVLASVVWLFGFLNAGKVILLPNGKKIMLDSDENGQRLCDRLHRYYLHNYVVPLFDLSDKISQREHSLKMSQDLEELARIAADADCVFETQSGFLSGLTYRPDGVSTLDDRSRLRGENLDGFLAYRERLPGLDTNVEIDYVFYIDPYGRIKSKETYTLYCYGKVVASW
jgi:hypothetical protein